MVEAMLAELCELIKEQVSAGGKVHLRGFGKFYAKRMSQRTARNPHTGETLKIPHRLSFSFTPSKKIKFLNIAH
jgi:DNA-binding protein HU-beta